MSSAIANSTPLPSTASSRLVFLDWVRILAFGLLVLYHVGMYYVGWSWHIKSPHASSALEPLMRLVSPWRLDLLFLVSGAATSFMLARGASGALLGARTKRLLLPLLFGMLVIVPPQSYFEVVQKFSYAGDYFDFMRLYLSGYGGFCGAGATRCLILPTWNHLWFLPYLLAYTLVLWGLLRWRPLLDPSAQRMSAMLSGVRLFVLPMLFLALTRIALREHFPVTRALVDDWFAHTQYFAMFMLGAVLARAPAVWERFMRARWIALALALAAWTVLIFALKAAPLELARPVAYSLVQWCGIVAALGFARRYLNQDGALRRYLTDAVFPVYILHQTLTILLARALAPAELAPAIEAAWLVAGTFALSFLGYECVRRVRWLRPLFGLKRIATSQSDAHAVPQTNSLSHISGRGLG